MRTDIRNLRKQFSEHSALTRPLYNDATSRYAELALALVPQSIREIGLRLLYEPAAVTAHEQRTMQLWRAATILLEPSRIQPRLPKLLASYRVVAKASPYAVHSYNGDWICTSLGHAPTRAERTPVKRPHVWATPLAIPHNPPQNSMYATRQAIVDSLAKG